MASAKVFFDTNILIYSDDLRDERKTALAKSLLYEHRRKRTGVMSTQVLLEYVATMRKLNASNEIVRGKLLFFSRFLVIKSSTEDILAAADLVALHQISIWDAMIVQGALRSGSRILYSEDMQHGRRFDELQILNPFL